MAANWELMLLSSIIKSPEATSAYQITIEAGITSQMFVNAEARTIWSYIEYYYNRPDAFGRVPSEIKIKERYEFADLPTAQETLEDLCRIVKERHVTRRTEAAIEVYTDACKKDPFKAVQDLSTTLSSIQEMSTGAADVSFSSCGLRETLEELERIEETSGTTGMPYPWARLNKVTGGINPGDYILAYALPKSMKTWIGLYMATTLAATGRKVLVYSKEMMWPNMRRRIACILSRVNYGKYRDNSLSPAERVRLMEAVEWFENDCPGDVIFTAADRTDGGAGGPAEIRRKIDIYKPQFVLLDSAYMLELPATMGANPYDWKSMALVNRQLKQIAKNTGIPIMAILQENERAAIKYNGTRGTASLAMNTSAIQDCDLAMRFVYHKQLEELSIHLPAARESRDEGFTIHAKAAENFEYAHDNLWQVGDGDDKNSVNNKDTGGEAKREERAAATGEMIREFGSLMTGFVRPDNTTIEDDGEEIDV